MELPATCEIRNWRCFAPGTFKEPPQYFSPAEVQKIGVNFARYSAGPTPQLQPLIKIGHHRGQRYSLSLGFPSLGKIVAAHTEPDNVFVVDQAVGIPRIVGSAINSGFLCSGSVEFPPKGAWRPPSDPNAEIDGDVLSGIALLGEELPGVPGYDPPRAVFADGSPVPPLTHEEQMWWLEQMAAIANPSESGATEDWMEEAYSARSLCFSALNYSAGGTTMEEKLLALGLTPEQVQQVMMVVATPAPAVPEPAAAVVPPAPEVKMAAEPEKPGEKKEEKKEDAPEWFSSFASEYKAFAADCTKRMGAIEAAKTNEKDEKESTAMAAFGAMADQVVARSAKKAGLERLKKSKEMILKELATVTFSSATERQGVFDEWVKGWDSAIDLPHFANQVVDNPAATGGKKAITEAGASILNSNYFKQNNPAFVKKMREKTVVVS